MLVDDAQQQPFSSFDSSLDEFFNLDVLNGASQPSMSASGSQSSASPRSPFSFANMPLTPPAFTNPSVPQAASADDAFFSLFLEDEYSKLPPLPPATSPYDFLSGLSSAGGAGIGIGAGSSPEASTSSGASPSQQANSPQPMFSIDPQLVGTPATSKALSDFDEEEESPSTFLSPHDEEEEEMDEEPLAAASKANGRFKGSRKGTVLSGGIKKVSALNTEKENAGKDGKSKKDLLPLKILEPEDWRPSPEEYKKMSSKEKRQLRNKISARNFRVRRKEYITTLEGDIAERDRLIDAIRSELGSSRSENVALRQEITALKKCLLEGRGLPELPPPAELPPTSPPIATASTSHVTSGASSSSVVTPNTQKDLPTSPRLGSRGFWGGLGGMGVTPVHTTFVPPLAVLASKASVPRSPSPLLGSNSPILQPSIFYEETVRSRVLQENINPGLNPGFSRGLVEKTGSANINPSLNGANMGGIGAFDAFADMNPFTLKTLDAYRMQLWGKMAAQQHAFHHSQSQLQQTHTPHSLSPSGLANGLRPHYFTSIPKASGALSPKAAAVGVGAGASAYPTPPASPAPSYSHATAGPSREQAAIAALASQTLLGKLGHAFWEAFSGSSPSGSSLHSASSPKQWDAEKVRKVLEGRAVVKVVDVEPLPAPLQEKAKTVEKTKACECPLTEMLEESMRTLTLGKK